ncbi:hypothetical protein J7K18_03910 [bacterium]|nr:hypothetical protein [bacterium]
MAKVVGLVLLLVILVSEALLCEGVPMPKKGVAIKVMLMSRVEIFDASLLKGGMHLKPLYPKMFCFYSPKPGLKVARQRFRTKNLLPAKIPPGKRTKRKGR